jgi:hypothetical protein
MSSTCARLGEKHSEVQAELMAVSPYEKRFGAARAKLVGTARGQEAAMYRPLGDLFVEALGYASGDVDADIRGARGRPDLTIWAPGPVHGSNVAWIVVEAKDEHGICRNPARRAGLFAEKAKYITADTAWFVMADPTTLVARPADRGGDPSTDIVLDLATLTLADFQARWADLRAEVAGVPHLLHRFREGDERLIATERLTGGGDALAEELARNTFFDGLEETTHTLQRAALAALAAIRPEREALLAEVDAFAARFHGFRFHPYPVGIEGFPKGREEALVHGREAHRLNRLLAADPSLARLTLNALPAFAERTGIDPKKEAAKLDQFFATETANLILARILLIRFLEDHAFFDESTPDGVRKRRYVTAASMPSRVCGITSMPVTPAFYRMPTARARSSTRRLSTRPSTTKFSTSRTTRCRAASNGRCIASPASTSRASGATF